jgi:hypothetical protein
MKLNISLETFEDFQTLNDNIDNLTLDKIQRKFIGGTF